MVIKAIGGGGGRGMRVVGQADDVEQAYARAASEAGAAFGNAGLLVEAFVPVARHVEVQVVADQQGTVWALGTRDCSMQRRNQKVIEEAPAPGLDDAIIEFIATGRPLLGICVGMQLMATRGFEHGTHAGFAWIPGDVRALETADAVEDAIPLRNGTHV